MLSFTSDPYQIVIALGILAIALIYHLVFDLQIPCVGAMTVAVTIAPKSIETPRKRKPEDTKSSEQV